MKKILFILFLLTFAAYGAKSEILPLPQELQSGELPWFAMTVENNGAYNGVLNKDGLRELVKEKNCKGVIISFYATWCAPCREGLKKMNENAAEFKKRNLLVVLADIGEEDYGKINKFIKPYAQPEWLLGFDRFGNIPEKFGLAKEGEEMAFPKTLVLDSTLIPQKLIGVEGDDFPQVLWGVDE